MKHIILLVLLCLLGSCSLFKNGQCDRLISKEARVLAKIKEKCKDCLDSSKTVVREDTTIAKQELKGEIDLKVDSLPVDSLIRAYADSIDRLLQECDGHEEDKVALKTKMRELEYELEAQINKKLAISIQIAKPVEKDTLDISFRIWQDKSGKLLYSIIKKEQQIHLKKVVPTFTINCPDKPFYKVSWFWMFILACIFLLFAAYKGLTK